jgi:hypothetical protein
MGNEFSTPVRAVGNLVVEGISPRAGPTTQLVEAAQASLHAEGSGLHATNDAAELAALLAQFKRRLDDPLLSLPDPKVVRRRLFSVSKSKTTARRSKRLAAKGKGLATSVVKRAQRLLMLKLGICREEDRLSDSQLKEYAAIFASPLGPEQIEAIATLFGLTCAVAGAGEAAVDAPGA